MTILVHIIYILWKTVSSARIYNVPNADLSASIFYTVIDKVVQLTYIFI